MAAASRGTGRPGLAVGGLRRPGRDAAGGARLSGRPPHEAPDPGPPVPRVAELLAAARRRLAAASHRPPTREAALLLARVLGLGEAQLLARSAERPTASEAARFLELVERRLTGEPVAYLLGEKEFYGRPFTVDRRVLIPRPETEHLVEATLELALPAAPRLLDLGTGSGCLAVTLALELAGARVVAVDRSPGALAVAAANVRRHRVGDRVLPAAGDLASAVVSAGFDLVVANPPYVDPRTAPDLSREVTGFEPGEALFAGDGGTAMLGRLLAELGELSPGTPLLVEIGRGQAAPLARLAAGSAFDLVSLRPDLRRIPRVAHLRRRG